MSKRLVRLAPLLVASVAFAAMCVPIGLHYRVALQMQEARLVAAVSAEARHLEAIARKSGLAAEAILENLAHAQDAATLSGTSGEFMMGVRRGDTLQFLLTSHAAGRDRPAPLRVDSGWAQPMVRATAGLRGSMIGRDYRGVPVLAAYDHVADLDFGIVAKVDLSEVRAPFLRACLLSLLIVVVLVGSATLVLMRRAGPALQDFEDSQRRLLFLADAIADVIWTSDQDLRWTYISRSITRLTGYSPDEAMGMSLDEMFTPASAAHLAALAEAVRSDATAHPRTDHPPVTLEAEFRCRGGGTVWAEVNAAVLTDHDGRLLGFTGISRDITQRRAVERQYARARDAAEAASRAKSEFLANMSHEIRTPMTAILGYLELLAHRFAEARPGHRPLRASDGPAPADPSPSGGLGPWAGAAAEAGHPAGPELLGYIDTISRNAHHLMQIIDDILDLSKIEAGKLDLASTRVAVEPLLAEVLESLQARARLKGISLTLTVQPGTPRFITSDPLRIRQILLNLLGNALKFTESGGVAIRARRAGEAGCPQVEVEIRDTGIGMRPDQVARLFQPFTQGDSSVRRRYGGTGLGLSISKRLAELLHGDLRVSSVEGLGSTFTLALPALPAEEQQPDHTPPAEPSLSAASPTDPPRPLAGCRCLLAEDGPDNQRILSLLLSLGGAEVTVACNGRQALDKALHSREAGDPFHVILMDMQMPILDGYEATRRLRAAGWTGPVVALTAHAMFDDRRRSIDAGCDEYLTKPIDRATLWAAVARMWNPGLATPQAATPSP